VEHAVFELVGGAAPFDDVEGSVSNFVFKAVLIRPGLLRQGEKNRLTAPSPG